MLPIPMPPIAKFGEQTGPRRLCYPVFVTHTYPIIWLPSHHLPQGVFHVKTDMSFNFLTDRAIKSSLDIVMVALLPRFESGTAVGMFDGKVVCGV